MAELLASGRLLDLILIGVGLEALALVGWRLYRGGNPSAASLASNLAAGAALMLALRAALLGAHWTLLAGWLSAAFVAHIADLSFRFQDARRAGRFAAGGAAAGVEHRRDRVRSRGAGNLD